MAQSKILVDTNSYIRLAQSIRPLLFAPFGVGEYCLYILPELNKELSARRLNSKFAWVNDGEYEENRKHFPSIGRKQKKLIETNFEFIWDHVETDLQGPSRVDALYIAYALELEIPIVTDDQDMTQLAAVFEVEMMSTLKLLKLMQDSGHIDIKAVRGIVGYWKEIGDCPANLHRDLKQYFPEF